VSDFTLEDHRDLACILRDVNSKWLIAIGDHPEIRKLYADFDQSRITSAMALEKVIGRKRGRLTHLLIRNYEPAGTPLYAPVPGQLALLDLLGT